MFSALPKTTEAQILGKQVLRSGTSIGANYREAYRGRSKAEFIAKCDPPQIRSPMNDDIATSLSIEPDDFHYAPDCNRGDHCRT